jgi:hypothetical protein
MPSMLTHPETLVVSFHEWLNDHEHGLDPFEAPADGNLAQLIAIWMQEGGADRAATHDAFLRFVALVVAEAAAGHLTVDADGEAVGTRVRIPTRSADWWMLEPMEFEAARSRRHSASKGP